MEGSTPREENKISSEKQLSYKKDLWMYFGSINEKFYYERNKAKTLLYIISQKNDIDYEYSENLNYLFNQFISQFGTEQEIINSNIDSEKNTLNKAIKSLINGLKYESELYLNHTKTISDNIIKPLEGFIMSQCELSNEFIGLMKNYENEFMKVYNLVEKKQVNFFQGAKSVENDINKLEIFKNKIKETKNSEKNNNDDNNNEIQEEEENQKEMLEKMTEILEKDKMTAKQLQLDYQNYLDKANTEREKYIKLSENIYDKFQNLDKEFIKKIKDELIFLTKNKLNLIENIKNNITKTLQISNEINIEYEITTFITSKKTKFARPKVFEYIDYNPYIILRNRKGNLNPIQSEISSKIIECLKQTFKYEKPNKNSIQEQNMNFINDTVIDIWDGNTFNKTRLDTLFKEHIYRMGFLHMLNQYRVEGVFVLKNTSFQNFCMALTNLLEKSLIDEDYESIKFCMILSQTFYLQSEKKILLQSSMTLNSIWQNKNFWVKLIEYAIYEEINNENEYNVFLSEDNKSREKRVESAVMSNLITFWFNMKLFGYPEDKSKIVIDEFIKKYNIDRDSIYETNIAINDIQDDIISESVDSIINNEIKEDNEINIKNNENNNNENNNESFNVKIDSNNGNIKINTNNNLINNNINETKKSEDKNNSEIITNI